MGIAGQELQSLSLLVLSHDDEGSISITDSLRQAGVTVTHAATHETVGAGLEINQPDAVLALDQDSESIEWLNNFKYNASVPPITILLTDSLSSPDLLFNFDLIIPADALHHLEYFLQPYLKLRGQVAQVNAYNRQLQHENKRLERELSAKQTPVVDVNLLKNSIVHSVSHELRTPMLQVKSAVALLAEDAGTNRNIVELALEATTRLEAGVRNVTLLNELMNESLETQSFSPVEMGQIIQSAIRNLRRSWEHKQAVDRIQVNLPDKMPPIWGDRQRLVIAIQLLLDNALKFSEKVVRIVISVSGEDLNIAVQDQGIGIPAEHLSHIFDPFYQVDGSSTRRFGGMGIGLAIVRFILDYHQTQIQVTTSPSAGSTFSFTLPLASPHSLLG